jgi:MerR family transcriptional regulator, light-induced transcriptional regulator
MAELTVYELFRRNMTDTDHDLNSNKPLSTVKVAAALGVSVTTVKRWVDEGILPAHKTAGGHRKFVLADILRVVRDVNLPRADLAALWPTPKMVPETSLEMLLVSFRTACVQCDCESIRTVLNAADLAGFAMDEIADRIISPAMATVGELWANGEIDVAHEHTVSQATVAALYEIGAAYELTADPNRPIAIGGAPEHDFSTLPTLLARLTLLQNGWNAINLGPHTPLSAFMAALDDQEPRLVWLAASHIFDTEQFLADYREFFEKAKARNIAVAIGGRAINESLRRQMSYSTYGDGLSHLATFAKLLHRMPDRPKRGRPPGRSKRSVPIPAPESI